MEYGWDPAKAANNLKKHGVHFADATAVFMDDHAITISDDRHYEERYITIGMDSIGKVLVVVFTYRNEQIRLISARKATRKERQQYQEI
ncbi:MAG: BrnT family toxin [Anaerolineales bacterium]|nr:BrnT family toxin [Anaerolineales bacterium]MCB0016441.1 BrnT family toxin [Anaerolineales bacterium]